VHAGVIFYLSSRPFPNLPVTFDHMDKIAHVGIFALLALLVAWGLLRAFPGWPPVRALLLALLVAVAYGALDELHQRSVPGRTPDPMDLAADGVGAGTAVAALALRRRGARPGVQPP
jgi:VanZ family protein